jgi:DNA-binding transcriptional LysR family regulator
LRFDEFEDFWPSSFRKLDDARHGCLRVWTDVDFRLFVGLGCPAADEPTLVGKLSARLMLLCRAGTAWDHAMLRAGAAFWGWWLQNGPAISADQRQLDLRSPAIGEQFDPRATLDDCRKTALGQASRLRIGFLGGGLYELTLPFVRHLRSKFHIDVEWVELSLLDQFEAVAVGKVDAAFCRLPLSHDGLVQCTVLLEEKKKLVVPADHRLSDRDLIDPEELALETLPTLPDNHQLGAWAAIHFPDHTPSGRPIARGPVVTTIRECLAVVESGEAVVIVGARAEHYYSNPRIRFIEIGVPPVGTALVRRRADRRRVIQDLEECSRDVAAGLVNTVEH